MSENVPQLLMKSVSASVPRKRSSSGKLAVVNDEMPLVAEHDEDMFTLLVSCCVNVLLVGFLAFVSVRIVDGFVLFK